MRQLPYAAVLLALVTACGVSDGGGDQQVARSGRIAFAVNRAGFNEIWTMNPDGTARHRLTQRAPARATGGSQQPAWSPSHNWIAYTRSGPRYVSGQRDAEIYVMRADGSGKRRLTKDNTADFAPAWSPDENRIAFTRAAGLGQPDATTGIYTMDARGGDLHELISVSAPAFIWGSAWSPDGRELAYTRTTFDVAGTRSEIYIVDASGGSAQKLAGQAVLPAWSPDGKWIAFLSDRDSNGRCLFEDCSGYAPELYVMRADGSDARRVTHTKTTEADPSWSPDGRRIAFSRIANENSNYDIYTIRPDGTGLRRITRHRGHEWNYQPSWGRG